MKFILIMLVSCSLCSCIWIPQSLSVPHANLKLDITGYPDAESVVAIADKAILSLGYERQPNDWREWVSLYDEEELERKKLERKYSRDDLQVTYDPELPSVIRTTSAIHLHYYQNGLRQFDQIGITGYEELRNALSAIGLPLAEETEADREAYREVFTPGDFNERHPLPSPQDRARNIRSGAFSLFIYSIFVFAPGFKMALEYFRPKTWRLRSKRAAFVASSSVLLAPGILPISIVGPMLLVPMPIAAPLAFEGGIEYTKALAISVSCTTLVAGCLSLLIRRTDA